MCCTLCADVGLAVEFVQVLVGNHAHIHTHAHTHAHSTQLEVDRCIDAPKASFRHQCLPSFLVVGALKGGTSSLYSVKRRDVGVV